MQLRRLCWTNNNRVNAPQVRFFKCREQDAKVDLNLNEQHTMVRLSISSLSFTIFIQTFSRLFRPKVNWCCCQLEMIRKVWATWATAPLKLITGPSCPKECNQLEVGEHVACVYWIYFEFKEFEVIFDIIEEKHSLLYCAEIH